MAKFHFDLRTRNNWTITRKKRQLGFAAVYILSNVISFLKSDQSQLIDVQRNLYQQLNLLNQKINVQELMQKANLAALRGLNSNIHLLDGSISETRILQYY